ncbi:helix-turn-helix transcriptional regulator [Saccharothrix variisporea]|uniref:Regulatory LuxR family protein n=1 Tax=Saccharothrix variisporea TaxID=543527 RepID=A0A495X4E9_9PSEU|nr:LuxR family transcriptional regulator [Saccharothrix variisporea]RKT69151.1 regulatory LuxR family protein [Saccharothrix variisporea]
MTLLDRAPERAALDELLAAARDGRSGVVVLVGEPGIGKTALLGYGVEAATGFTVARVTGVESEREWGYAGLHRLLLPLSDARASLPQPQRDALAVAFGQVAGPPPDRFLVGLAVLTLLSRVAVDAPVLVVCDDAQWLDRASVEVLAFVGRRLLAERVVLLFAARPDLDADLTADLEHRTLPGLPAADAVSLLTGVDRALGLRIAEAAGGNPLVLAELARELDRGATTPDRLAGVPLLGGPLPVGRRLEARFAARVGALAASTRTFLLVVAAEATGDAGVVRRACALLELEGWDAVVEDAVRSGLVVAEPSAWAAERFTFPHPAVRSAVYAGGSVALRRRVHAALAAATPDDDRRAWHLAAAVEGPDEGVAGEVERCAGLVGARGGHMARSALLAMAARLSPERADHDRRLVAAADAAVTAGAVAHARDLLDRLDPGSAEHPRALRLRGLLDEDVSLLVDAAGGLVGEERTAALLEAVDLAVVGGGPIESVASAVGGGHLGAAGLVLESGAALLSDGFVSAAPGLRAAVRAVRDVDVAGRWCLLGLLSAVELWDEESLGVCAARFTASARDRGEPRALLTALSALATWEVFCGRLTAAAGHLTEFAETATAAAVRSPLAGAADALLAAWRGDRVDTGGTGLRAAVARAASMVLDLGHGRYQEALATGKAVLDERPAHWGGAVLADLVEAAVRSGDLATAQRALRDLTDRAEASGTPWARGLLARARALTSEDAEPHHREAVDRLGRTPLIPDLARAHLLHGEWLRRRRRRAEATTSLRTAHELFTGIGATAFAHRAEQELRAAGSSPRPAVAAPRAPETAPHPAGTDPRAAGTDPRTTGHPAALPRTAELTPQEARIAALVADGATNQEIATTLFLSVSTVEYHLRKIFRKLDVTSRRQIRLVLR